MGFYTLFILGGIYYYEDKLKSFESDHKTIKRLIEISRLLDEDNRALNKLVKSLKSENSAIRNGIQYEYTAWSPSTFNSSYYESVYKDTQMIIEL
jgi:hypothetical protein